MAGGGLFEMMFTIVPIFIAIVALFTFGGIIATFAGFLRHRKMIDKMTSEVFDRSGPAHNNSHDRNPPNSSASRYSCSKCGAALGPDTEISPSGDFKCEYCNSWSNVNT